MEEINAKTFIRQLKMIGVYGRFITNTKEYALKHERELKCVFDYKQDWSSRIYDVIDSSFCWADTEEGHAFWKFLHDEYKYLGHNVLIDVKFVRKKLPSLMNS